jgi:hypothetical protein
MTYFIFGNVHQITGFYIVEEFSVYNPRYHPNISCGTLASNRHKINLMYSIAYNIRSHGMNSTASR